MTRQTYSEGFYILTAKIIMKSRFDNRFNTEEKLKSFIINPLKKQNGYKI